MSLRCPSPSLLILVGLDTITLTPLHHDLLSHAHDFLTKAGRCANPCLSTPSHDPAEPTLTYKPSMHTPTQGLLGPLLTSSVLVSFSYLCSGKTGHPA